MRATLDAGNSSSKLRLWALEDGAAPVRVGQGEFPSDERGIAALAAFLEQHGEIASLACSFVVAPELERELGKKLERRLGARALLAPDSALDNLCREPHTTGSDRLFAARGAFERLGRACIVIDAGTAVTVDALLAPPERKRAAFAGGAIAPGPKLLALSLSAGTARLPRIEARPTVPALGRETREALESGVVHGFRGAVRELATRIAGEAGLEGAPWIVTGGASVLLREPRPFVKGASSDALRFDADLVHIGLLCASLDRERGVGDATPRYGWS